MPFRPYVFGDDESVLLKKFDGSLLLGIELDYIDDDIKKICFLDLETTGLNISDMIVELAIKLVAIEKHTGRLIKILDSYESFNDPGFTMDERNIAIHGISNEMVKDKFIDWDRVKDIFDDSEIIVAHNARFDRSFMDRDFSLSDEKVWACSVNDIDWPGMGFNSRSQELLCMWHGFYYESHRAMSDVDALIYLVTHDSYDDQKPIKQLIDNAYQIGYKVLALNSSFQQKDILRSNGYSWNGDDKYWWKTVKEDALDAEKKWLEESVYLGTFLGQVELLTPSDRYK